MSSLVAVAASQLTSRPTDWLWSGRLGLGKLAMLDGDPGLGKSLVALDLCARLSTGKPFPDGSPRPGPANSLVMSGEDGPEDTLLQRLAALGADLSRVFVLPPWDPATGQPLRLPVQLAVVADNLARSEARLLVIDPITAFLDPTVHTHIDASVRRLTLPLWQIAEARHCAVLLLRHLNKDADHRSLYRGSGSIAFLGACRSGWLLAPEPQSPGRCVLAQVKNNLAPVQPSLAFELHQPLAGPVVLTWQGPCSWTADQLLAAVGQPAPLPTEADRACDFLAAVLENGPLTSREIWRLAQPQEFSKRTLDRARQTLDIKSERVWIKDQVMSYWLLPGQQLPAEVAPKEEFDEVRQALAELEARYPRASPLDDV